ncbi:MaoC family dehydratase [Alkalihalobacillus sp. AL-G]|uniref:MaoC family dehydratase n=1 Tax=Alkalihalobacillus sp. AL-G TaxID=2926399 RepID=UPI00272B935D|nr:MaoC family dehydratase [Alkalihalobacillus sp. AL-G]WLD91704.1 MaoC family dehydratase [Alkalihalobacillus sp. AL-G]
MPELRNINVGDKLEPIESEPITLKWLKKYAEISGDQSMIHLDQEAARESGFSNIIVHGMLSMGIASRLLSPWFDQCVRESTFSVRFTAPLYIGDRLIVCGKVIDINHKTSTIRFIVNGRNPSGKLILKGTTELSLHQ